VMVDHDPPYEKATNHLERIMNESAPFTPPTSTFVRGVVHGKTIELESPLNVQDGETVEIHVRVAPDPKRSLERLLRASGAFANDPQSDADFELLERERKASFSRGIDE